MLAASVTDACLCVYLRERQKVTCDKVSYKVVYMLTQSVAPASLKNSYICVDPRGKQSLQRECLEG